MHASRVVSVGLVLAGSLLLLLPGCNAETSDVAGGALGLTEEPTSSWRERHALRETDTFRLDRETRGPTGRVHRRYSLSRGGTRIERATFLAHLEGGRLVSERSSMPELSPADRGGVLPEERVLALARDAVGASRFDHETGESGASTPTVGRVYHVFARERIAIPAQHVRLVALEPFGIHDVYVDVETSRVEVVDGTYVADKGYDGPGPSPGPGPGPSACDALPPPKQVVGSGDTHFDGAREIVISPWTDTHRLLDASRTRCLSPIHTRRMTVGQVEITDVDGHYTAAEHAPLEDDASVGVHFVVGAFYDFLAEDADRFGWDGKGRGVRVWTNCILDLGKNASFGDGVACIGFNYGAPDWSEPLATTDVIAHELGHGITLSDSALDGLTPESLALHEGISDAWAAMFEHWASSHGLSVSPWQMAEDLSFVTGGKPKRRLDNPNSLELPDTYFGDYWSTGSELSAVGHHNATVFGHLFYLIVVGGSGVNDHDYPYDVEGIGWDDAMAWLLATYPYLLHDDGYYDLRDAGLSAAEELWGYASPRYWSVFRAFEAVGIYTSL